MEKFAFWTNPKRYWIRWISLLPVSVSAYVIMYGLMKLMLTFFTRVNEEGDLSIAVLLAPGIASTIGSYWFVWMGWYFAPGHKRIVRLLLIIIAAIVAGLCTVLLIRQFTFNVLIEIIGIVVGIIAAYFKIENEGDDYEYNY